MKKRYILLIIGILSFIMPLLGFPQGFKNTFAIMVGLVLMILSYLWSNENLNNHHSNKKIVDAETFTEHQPNKRVDTLERPNENY